MKNAYAVLGIPVNATAEEIRSAARLLDEFHTGFDTLAEPGALERLADIRTAYNILSDPASRAAHDRMLGAMNEGVFLERKPKRPSFVMKGVMWAVVLLMAGVSAGVLVSHFTMQAAAAVKQPARATGSR